jgi:hypothetical protein
MLSVEIKDRRMLSKQYLTMDPDQVDLLTSQAKPDPRNDMGKRKRNPRK